MRADHSICAEPSLKVPRNFCAALLNPGVAVVQFHRTLKESVAGTGCGPPPTKAFPMSV